MSRGQSKLTCLSLLIAWHASAAEPPRSLESPTAAPQPQSSEAAKPTSGGTKSLDELLLFFPAKHPAGNWNPRSIKFQDVNFESSDKTRLHGWYCPCDRPRAVVLVAHGNAGNVAMRAEWLAILQKQLRVATLMFDYRGYGRSEGVPTVEGVLDDARAARAKLSELSGVPEPEIVLMGESLGGAVAVQLAGERPARALILQSTFSSLRDAADVHYPRLSWLVAGEKLNSASAIVKHQGPLLLSHGTQDQTIPFALGLKLFKAANAPKSIVAIKGADHNDWLSDEYLKQLSAFIDRL